MRSVVCTTLNTRYRLSVLLAALDGNFPTRLGYLILQMDQTATGSLYIGNSLVAANNCGADLIPGGSITMGPEDNSLILTTDIYMVATANLVQVNVTAIGKGM